MYDFNNNYNDYSSIFVKAGLKIFISSSVKKKKNYENQFNHITEHFQIPTYLRPLSAPDPFFDSYSTTTVCDISTKLEDNAG